MVSTMNIEHGPLCRLFPGKVLDFTTLRGRHDASDPYSGFSVCGYTGDRAEHYLSCRAALAADLGINDPQAIIQPRQVHGDKIAMLDDAFFALDIQGQEKLLDGADGTITARRQVAIGINTADCVPILLYSYQETQLVAAIHAGWRGTLAGIAAKAVRQMVQAGARKIAAYIGVSICRQCFEVGDEVAEAFASAGLGGEIISRNKVTGKAHIDLQAANRHQLAGCGIAPEMIFTDGRCSRHDASGNYFSARRIGVHSGRTFTGIMLL